MLVTTRGLETENGFESQNFKVDADGNILAKSINVRQIALDGSILFDAGLPDDDGEPSAPQTSLSPTIINSSLETLGTLSSLTVEGNTTISDGLVQITSSTTGTINNINIGDVTPGDATFVSLTATNGTITTLGSTTLTANTITSSTVTVSNSPTLGTHATNKSYVDTQITALSIALGM